MTEQHKAVSTLSPRLPIWVDPLIGAGLIGLLLLMGWWQGWL